MKRKLISKSAIVSLLSALASIAIGLLVGLILLYIMKPTHAMDGFVKILTTGFKSSMRLGKVLYQTAPLILTGLSVGFAFKMGLFNIGASGQYTMGAFFGLTAAIQFQQPWYIAMIFAMIGGAIWGMIPGLCKAYFNVNEVITSIMFNWIGLYTVNMSLRNMPMMIENYWKNSTIKDRTAKLTDANPLGVLPKGGLDELLGSNYVNVGIIIAIVVAIIIWVILQRTTFGYELKACGYNRSASEYAGINSKRNIVLSMAIAGGLAGLSGGVYYLGGTGQYVMVKNLLTMGFDGIPVALLASSHPLGIVFSAFFISYLQVGGDALQPNFVSENTEIIIATIIYMSAFALLMKGYISKWLMGKNETNVNQEVSALETQTKKEDKKV